MEFNNDENNAPSQGMNDDGDALISFEAPLFVRGNDDDAFRARNLSMEDWNRRIVLERRTRATTIQCFLLDVLHGKLSKATESPSATLLVFKFRLEPIKHGRRLVRARIDVEFFSKDPEHTAPAVLAIGVNDRWTVGPTVDHEDVAKGGRFNLGLSGIPFIEAGGEASLEKTKGRDIHGATTVTGGTHFGQGIDAGEHTACGWTLLENKQRETGLPDSFTVPVLLQRHNDRQFNAVVDLDVEGNLRTTIDCMFSKIPVDDTVLFNPTVDRMSRVPMKEDRSTEQTTGEKEAMKPTAQKYAKDELGQWETRMRELTHVILSTTLQDSMREI